MVDFDALNRRTMEYKNTHCSHPTSDSRDNGRMGMSPQQYLAYLNNETFRAHNGAYPDRPYGPDGTYSKGK